MAYAPAALEAALWTGDVDTLHQLAPCGCCCDEHTYDNCPARAWYGCRGQNSLTQADIDSWVRHYESAHNMTREAFFFGA
jgi:hypothetical protein